MATRTSYLNLIKPDYTDAADIADINANMDTLDNTIQGLDETGSKSLTAHNNATDAHSAMQTTISDTLAPTADLNTICNLLSNLGNRIKAATGADGWKRDPATTLASLATLVSNLSSGSDVTWSGTKFTNAKLGISGVIDQNGYVSFGPNFGGLIIQWGVFESADPDIQEAKSMTVPLNVSVNNVLNVQLTDSKFSQYPALNVVGAWDKDKNTTSSFHVEWTNSPSTFGWNAICK
nr:MAG TPA: putative tail fiber protein [Caudoviricetes sp.]